MESALSSMICHWMLVGGIARRSSRHGITTSLRRSRAGGDDHAEQEQRARFTTKHAGQPWLRGGVVGFTLTAATRALLIPAAAPVCRFPGAVQQVLSPDVVQPVPVPSPDAVQLVPSPDVVQPAPWAVAVVVAAPFLDAVVPACFPAVASV